MTFFAFLRANAPFLAAGALLTFASSFGQTFFISIFAGEIRAAFDLSHGAWGTIYAMGTTASALAMVWTGLLIDRFRVRVLGAGVLVCLSLACLGMAAMPVVWLLPLGIFALRLFGQGMCMLIATVAMARWFIAARGRALSIAIMGVEVGSAVLPLAFVALMDVVSWRMLWVLAALMALCLVPLLLPLLRLERTPQAVAQDTQAVGMLGRQWHRRDMLRHWLFWLLIPSLLAPSAFSTAMFFQQVHLAEVKGWDHIAFVALIPVFTLGSVVAMLVSGWLIDRLGTARLMPLYQIPLALAFFIMSGAESLVSAGIAMALLGMTQGANSTVPNAFWAEFFGTRHLGGIRSLATAVLVFGTALGPALTGALIDAGIVFPDQMVGIGLYVLAAAVLTGIAVIRAKPLLSAPEIHVVRP
ncbi:MFS transporter [Mesobaculum littorinae]|uniref:MFS transporter n=1 Tax=Mesobaculum littorinae TaxID=2486419 RepID=A0A438AH17_9RHOB|nr:MFS transporter [Mesobaculum littorinae]RVV98006.1 MFS transporter [Mesobaculum littorinae]